MIEFHRKMLADRGRNAAFTEALRKVIVPGQTVVADIGAGTGYLSFVASKIGAKECHCYESGDVWAVAKQIAEKNGIQNCHFTHRSSLQVRTPVQADVVVSETLGNFALEEHLLENMADARKRFLKPGGTLIPGRLTQYAAPVVTDRLTREVDTWGDVGFGLDYSPARSIAFHNAYVKTVLPSDLPGGEEAAQVLETIDLSQDVESRRKLSATWKIAADTAVFGVAVWWQAELVPGIMLSTSPFGEPTHWEQIVLFVPEPLQAAAGDALLLALSVDSRVRAGINLTWKLSLFRDGKSAGASPVMDMRKGFLA